MMSKENVNEIAIQAGRTTPLTIMEETDPALVLKDATAIANQLSDIIEKQHLYAEYKGGKKHVLVEGWTTLGALTKVFAIPEGTRKIERDGEIIYEATAVAKTLSGQVVGKGIALCSDKEVLKTKRGLFKRWQDEHSVESMAQTRAISKCLRYPLGWIMTLAGYEATPEAEMPPKEQPVMTQDDGSEILPPKPKNKVRTKKAKQEPTLDAETVEKIFKKCPKLEEAFKDIVDYENTIPKITMLRKADALLQDKEISQEHFNSIKKLI